MNGGIIVRESLTTEQKASFLRNIRAGMDLTTAATAADIDVSSLDELSDVLSDNTFQAAVGDAVHRDIKTTGKALAWRTMKDAMTSPRCPWTVKLAAARWTLEAADEGVGATRKQRNKTKDIHEMDNAELASVIQRARDIVEGTAIDVTPALPVGADDMFER